MEWIMYLGGIIFYIIVSYIASAAILELFKTSDLKSINILALVIFLLMLSVTNYSQKKDRFNREHPELKDDF